MIIYMQKANGMFVILRYDKNFCKEYAKLTGIKSSKSLKKKICQKDSG
jgi:hypothetical protein